MKNLRTFLLLLAATGVSRVSFSEEKAKPTILIAYDSRTGFTEQMARAVAEGAGRQEGIAVVVKRQDGVEDEEIREAAGIILGSPVHWGNLSAATKSFIDRVGDVLVRSKELGPGSTPRRRTAGAFVTGGAVSSGKELARIAILAAFLNMRFIVVGGEESDGFGNLGAQATTGPSDPGLSDKELEDARRFGERFASITLALVR